LSIENWLLVIEEVPARAWRRFNNQSQIFNFQFSIDLIRIGKEPARLGRALRTSRNISPGKIP
jgi:hypothetical protein